MKIFSSLLMIVALCWLTVSLPFVFAAKQKYQSIQLADTGNTTEEKVPTTFSEEYLHQDTEHEYSFTDLNRQYNIHHYPLYIAFHGELISPPPES